MNFGLHLGSGVESVVELRTYLGIKLALVLEKDLESQKVLVYLSVSEIMLELVLNLVPELEKLKVQRWELA